MATTGICVRCDGWVATDTKGRLFEPDATPGHEYRCQPTLATTGDHRLAKAEK